MVCKAFWLFDGVFIDSEMFFKVFHSWITNWLFKL